MVTGITPSVGRTLLSDAFAFDLDFDFQSSPQQDHSQKRRTRVADPHSACGHQTIDSDRDRTCPGPALWRRSLAPARRKPPVRDCWAAEATALHRPKAGTGPGSEPRKARSRHGESGALTRKAVPGAGWRPLESRRHVRSRNFESTCDHAG